MTFWPFEVTTPHIIYAVLGAFIVLFGMFSLLLRERLYVGEAIWAFVFGVIIGPYCANIFNPRDWASSSAHSDEVTNLITLEFTRVVLAIGVFAIGVELPKAYMKKHWRSLFFLLVPVMTWGWFVSAGLIYALIPGLNFLSSLAVAACLTPTDPILAAAVVGGKWADKHVPAHIRHLLAAESGCNDGAAFPFLFIALYLTIDKTVGAAIEDWFLLLWLYQVILGALIGCALGFSFRHLMKFCQRHNLIDRHSYVAQYISLAMLTIGVTTLLGSDDLLAAFFCGTAFAWDGFFNKQTEESVFSSVIDTLFNVAAFIYVGAWMPFNKFEDAELTLSVWRLLVIAILVLLLRRLPIMMLLYRWIPDIKTFREAVFSGHFGPIGVGAVFISTFALEILENAYPTHSQTAAESAHFDPSQYKPENEQTVMLMKTIQPIVAFMVLCSITIHGLSIPGFSLGRRVHSVSRTWSRRDTINSNRQSQPEWANQARMVGRPEDIVVNRDPTRAGLGSSDKESSKTGVDLERGDSFGVGLMEKSHSGTISGTVTAAASMFDPDVEMDDDEKLMESGLTGDTRSGLPTHVHSRSIDYGLAGSGDVTPNAITAQPGTPTGGLLTVQRPETRPHQTQSRQGQGQVALSDAENPPDGKERVSEWIEGSQRLIERRGTGDGSDVEVIVVPNEDKSHRPHRAEDIGHTIARELNHITQLGTHDATKKPEESNSERATQPHQDSAVADDDDEEGWASEPDNGVPPSPSGISASANKLTRTGSRSSKHSTRSAHRRRRGSATVRRNSNASADIVEEPRGRTGGGPAPAPTIATGSGDIGGGIMVAPSSPAVPSLSPRPSRIQIQTQPPPRRPRTAPSISSSSGAYPRPYSSRPGTADSAIGQSTIYYSNTFYGNSSPSSPRNQRVESIRQSAASRRGSRESSPSRSVRFVDEGSSGAFGNGIGAGKTGSVQLAESPVPEDGPGFGMGVNGPGTDGIV